MELNDLRALITLFSFLTFVGIVLWAYSGKRKEAFKRAAQAVLQEDGEGQ